VYRDAWTHERALELLRGGVRRQFDGRCLAALESVLAGERPAGRLSIAV